MAGAVCLQIHTFKRFRNRLLNVCLIFAVVSTWLAIQPPVFSLDIYRYLWDGHLLIHHISPYKYVPEDPHLRPLQNWPLWNKVGWKNWPEAYPPLAQLYFMISALIRDGDTIPLKLMVLVNQWITLLLFYRVLFVRRTKQYGDKFVTTGDIRAFTLFALFPPIVTELLGAGHVDAFVMPWLLAAWLYGLKQQPVRLGFALAAATAIKVYPLVLLPAFWQKRDWRFVFKMLGVFLIVLVVIYLPFLTPKLEVFAYFKKSTNLYYGASIQWWLRRTIAHVPHGSTLLMAGLELCAWLFVFTLGKQYTIERKVCILGFTFLLASPMMRPWYTVPFVPFAIVAGDIAILWLSVAIHAEYALSYSQFYRYLPVQYVPTYLIAMYQWMVGWRKERTVRNEA